MYEKRSFEVPPRPLQSTQPGRKFEKLMVSGGRLDVVDLGAQNGLVLTGERP
jgi:hypothetical protein